MYSESIDLSRNRTVTVEIFDDGCMGIEVTKNTTKPNYKNGESDYHEVYFNLERDEVVAIADFLYSMLIVHQDKFGEKNNVATR